MIVQALRNGSWVDVSISSIKDGDLFRLVSVDRLPGNMSENESGSDTFIATSDAVVEDDGSVHVTIDRPPQPKFGLGYLAKLRASGFHVEVRGSSIATGWTGDFRNV